MGNAISLLEGDHRRVEQLFERYEQGKDPSVLEELCVELSVHTAVEEEVVYPVLSSDVPGG